LKPGNEATSQTRHFQGKTGNKGGTKSFLIVTDIIVSKPLNLVRAWHLVENSGLDPKIFAQMLRPYPWKHKLG
jgi:hypothetical protein